MKKLMLLMLILCLSASVYAQSGGKVERITFEGMRIDIDRSRPDPDHSRDRNDRSVAASKGRVRVKTPLEAAREEVQRLLSLADDPLHGPFIANNPGIRAQHLKNLEAAMVHVRMLEDQARRAETARQDQERRAEAARREAIQKQRATESRGIRDR